MVLGMFLSFAAHVGGNLSELKQQWKTEPPFVFIDLSGSYEAGEALFNSFCKYLEAVFAAITEKLPGVLEEAGKLPEDKRESTLRLNRSSTLLTFSASRRPSCMSLRTSNAWANFQASSKAPSHH